MEIIDSEIIYESFYKENVNVYKEQSESTFKLIKYTILVVSICLSLYLLYPSLSHAKEIIKTKEISNTFRLDGVDYEKLYKEFDYRNKNSIKRTGKRSVKGIGRKLGRTIVKTNNILDLTKDIKLKLPENLQSVELVPLSVNYSSKKLQRIIFINGGAFSSSLLLLLVNIPFLPWFPGRDTLISKSIEQVKKLLRQNEEKEERKNWLPSFPVTSTFPPAIGTIMVIYWLLIGKLPKKTPDEYDELSPLIKPLVSQPTKMDRLKHKVTKPLSYVVNFSTPVPYIIIGSIILYFYKGKILAFITTTDQYKSAFGEFASILMNQLKTQFSEFVSFVKSTNLTFTEQMRTSHKEYTESIKETKENLKENLKEQKEILKTKESELKYCTINKEKLSLGFQECSLKYTYAKNYFENHLIKSNSNNVEDISIGIEQIAKIEAERILPSLEQDVMPLQIADTNEIKKKK